MMALQLDRAAKDLERRRRRRGREGERERRRRGGLSAWAAASPSCSPASDTDAVKAVVPFYGGIPWEDTAPDYSAITGAACSSNAPARTTGSPRTWRPRWPRPFATPATATSPCTSIDEAEHAFFNDTRPEVYDPEASALAWQRTLAFLRVAASSPEVRIAWPGAAWPADRRGEDTAACPREPDPCHAARACRFPARASASSPRRRGCRRI